MKNELSLNYSHQVMESLNNTNDLLNYNGLVMPADMSNELKNLNVSIDSTILEVTIL